MEDELRFSASINGEKMNIFLSGFIITFILFVVFVLKHDDDVARSYYDRKPTPDEAIRRVRYVLSIFFASIFGGCAAAIASYKHIILYYEFAHRGFPSKNTKDIYIILMIAIAFVLLRFMQNIIRLLQKRGSVGLVDMKVFLKNLRIRS